MEKSSLGFWLPAADECEYQARVCIWVTHAYICIVLFSMTPWSQMLKATIYLKFKGVKTWKQLKILHVILLHAENFKKGKKKPEANTVWFCVICMHLCDIYDDSHAVSLIWLQRNIRGAKSLWKGAESLLTHNAYLLYLAWSSMQPLFRSKAHTMQTLCVT